VPDAFAAGEPDRIQGALLREDQTALAAAPKLEPLELEQLFQELKNAVGLDI
jgi:hypothetical protein